MKRPAGRDVVPTAAVATAAMKVVPARSAKKTSSKYALLSGAPAPRKWSLASITNVETIAHSQTAADESEAPFSL